jgi:hypothetical protein
MPSQQLCQYCKAWGGDQWNLYFINALYLGEELSPTVVRLHHLTVGTSQVHACSDIYPLGRVSKWFYIPSRPSDQPQELVYIPQPICLDPVAHGQQKVRDYDQSLHPWTRNDLLLESSDSDYSDSSIVFEY